MNSAFVSYEELWRSLETGVVPTEWKIAKVIPIFKSGSMAEIDNYRPISILPTLSKILEKMVHKQLMKHLEFNGILSEHQFGFAPIAQRN